MSSDSVLDDRARPIESAHERVGIKIGDLAAGPPATIGPAATLREASKAMNERSIGSVIIIGDNGLEGILTERDILRAVATGIDLDATRVEEIMTRDVVTAGPDWEVYEAAAEMTDHHIRHLVVTEGPDVVGVVSVRDLLLAGQRVELSAGQWAVLRDPLTFTIRERRRLQRQLLHLEAGPRTELDLDELTGEIVGSWSFDLPLPATRDALEQLSPDDRELLRAAVREELPDLQRAVQPAPGWRRWRED